MWYVYIVRGKDQTLYTGITTDITRRLRQHNGVLKNGAKYTLPRRPMTLVYLESQPSRSAALKREATLKKLNRKSKERLVIAYSEAPKELW